MMIGAVLAALAGALCFGAASALQQREAMRSTTTSVGDPRLLWRLAHRPWWVVGVAVDAGAAALQVVALALGPVRVVQPLGVSGLLFGVLAVAMLRRKRPRAADLLRCGLVMIGLIVVVLDLAAATSTSTAPPVRLDLSAVTVAGTAAVGVAAILGGRRIAGPGQALVLSAGAGACFGVVAALIRAVIESLRHQLPAGHLVVLTAGLAVLAPLGFLLLQNAYRTHYFAPVLATAATIDPLAALLSGHQLLGEPLPSTLGSLLALLAGGATVVLGIVLLIRSPDHPLTLTDADPAKADEHARPGSSTVGG